MERFTFSHTKESILTKTYANGAVITVSKKLSTLPIGSVAMHEAAHVVAEEKIKKASIIPEGNALGITIPEKMTYTGAAAAASLGHGGTSWDMFLVKYKFGVDGNFAISQARRKLASEEKGEEIYEVASTLQQKKIIYQKDKDAAVERVKNRRNGKYSVDVKITFPEGRTNVFKATSYQSTVLIPGELVNPFSSHEPISSPKAA